ncbi:UDP-sugar [Carex littledalei]|uniref:UDP-sugar n=1 Tax=Carex littledalei TaxID=544730 RepID=A0A833QNT3_9POAL|nr:UDP-sugar [Carex littledalei]
MATAPPTANLRGSFFSSRSPSSHSLPFFSISSLPHTSPLKNLNSSLFFVSHSPLFPSQTHRVSTSPVEQAPAPDFGFNEEITRLKGILSQLLGANSLKEKIRVLDSDSTVREFFGDSNGQMMSKLEPFEVFLLKCLVVAGQEHVLGFEFDWGRRVDAGDELRKAFYALGNMIEKWSLHNGGEDQTEVVDMAEMEMLNKLLKLLGEMEQFYDCIGGIIGYQIIALELLSPPNNKSHNSTGDIVELHVPSGFNLLESPDQASQAALWGIEGLPELGEIYPIGGAGDRLGLVDPDTGECLPAALLPYCGRTLLEGLIRDLQAREFLYYKIFGKQCTTPVAIMTSSVKNNHKHILALCERLAWFGRGRQNFQLFEQPLVPVVVAEDGKWLVSRSLFPVCKPGGHGAIWKLAHDKGVFKWFYHHGRKGATVRQVSNVVAATDLTLLALAGLGLRHKKKLGFASCARSSGATEGINVLIEKKSSNGHWEYGISCIEYTEFEKYGITDSSISHRSLQVNYPANTNILYVDLRAAEGVGSSRNASCLPGMVLNLKKKISYADHLGFECSASGGRLECTMQNIADHFINKYSSRCNAGIESGLDTFMVYNERKRVTSSAKKKRKPEDKSLHQTPEGSLLDVMRNAYDILSGSNVNLPKVKGNSHYLKFRPPFLIFLHPALGPLWEIIRQKFVGGSITEGSELQLEIAEFFWSDVELEGSLLVHSDNVMGSIAKSNNDEQILHYGTRCGKCKLQKVKVRNKGLNWNSPKNVYWKNEVERFESLKIILHGNAEFEASDVTLEGDHVFEVPDGYRMCLYRDNKESGFSISLEPIPTKLVDSGSWYWKYNVEGSHIKLEMVYL